MEIKKVLLTPNHYSRPQTKLTKVTHIVIHWVGNANTSAMANRNYFESLRDKGTYASSHYIIGLEGEVLQCVPEDEIAYHAKEANSYSLGIENCHSSWDGRFNSKTYISLIELCAQLCKKYNLDPEEALLRHYDITKKICPKYYVERTDAWLRLKSLIELCAQLCKKYNLDPEEALLRHYDITKKICPKYYVERTDAWLRLKQDVKRAMQPQRSDERLGESLKSMIDKGVQLDIRIWGDVSTMNMKYAKLMVERIGQKFGKDSYTDTIDFLVAKGCINNREIWDKEQFKPEWCRALLIKVYAILFV